MFAHLNPHCSNFGDVCALSPFVAPAHPDEVIWAKAARGVWGMAHVFDGKLYFTRDHMQGNFIPSNLKLPEPKPAPKPQAKASSKASSSGEHVQLFRIVYDRKKGFQAEHL